MSFHDSFHNYTSKNKATSKKKIQQIFSSLYMNDGGICLTDEFVAIDVKIVDLHPTKGTHWVAYTNEFFLIIWLSTWSKTILVFYKTKRALSIF